MAKTRAQENRALRQEALREQLTNKGLVQQVLEIAQKLYKLDNEIDALSIQRLRAAADINLKLIAKYLPDLKSIEHTGSIEVTDERTISDEELLNIATNSSTGTTQPQSSKTKVH